jgi:hypothetical protein
MDHVQIIGFAHSFVVERPKVSKFGSAENGMSLVSWGYVCMFSKMERWCGFPAR